MSVHVEPGSILGQYLDSAGLELRRRGESPQPAAPGGELSDQGANQVLEMINRRAAIAAVRQEAARVGLNSEVLLDSKRLLNEVSALDIEDPGFPRRLAEIVQGNATARGLTPAGSPPPAAPAAVQPARSGGDAGHNGAPGGNRQWTEADVAALPKNREGARRLQAAMDAGLLTDLGYGVRGRRR